MSQAKLENGLYLIETFKSQKEVNERGHFLLAFVGWWERGSICGSFAIYAGRRAGMRLP